MSGSLVPGSQLQKKLQYFGWLFHAAGLLIAVAGVMLAVAFIYRPMVADLGSLEYQSSDLSQFLSTADDIESVNRQLSGELSEMEARLVSLKEQIPDSPCEADFLAQLTELAQQTGLNIRDYRPGSIVQKENYKALEVKLSAEGTYPSICRALDQLQNLPRLCRITNLKVAAPNASTKKYPLEMTLQIYFAPLEEFASEDSEGHNG